MTMIIYITIYMMIICIQQTICKELVQTQPTEFAAVVVVVVTFSHIND